MLHDMIILMCIDTKIRPLCKAPLYTCRSGSFYFTAGCDPMQHRIRLIIKPGSIFNHFIGRIFTLSIEKYDFDPSVFHCHIAVTGCDIAPDQLLLWIAACPLGRVSGLTHKASCNRIDLHDFRNICQGCFSDFHISLLIWSFH